MENYVCVCQTARKILPPTRKELSKQRRKEENARYYAKSKQRRSHMIKELNKRSTSADYGSMPIGELSYRYITARNNHIHDEEEQQVRDDAVRRKVDDRNRRNKRADEIMAANATTSDDDS